MASHFATSASSAILATTRLIEQSTNIVAFTGAGISVESGIPSFRGRGGLWDQYDPTNLELSFFQQHPERAWPVIKEIFYDNFGGAEPNPAHHFLAALESTGKLKGIVTQNIDGLHQAAGSQRVIEYHGSVTHLVSMKTGIRTPVSAVDLSTLPPRCPQGGIYKPDFVFFGENIPRDAAIDAESLFGAADLVLVWGSSGTVYPAAGLPAMAAANGIPVVDINPESNSFTDTIATHSVPLSAAMAADILSRSLNLTA